MVQEIIELVHPYKNGWKDKSHEIVMKSVCVSVCLCVCLSVTYFLSFLPWDKDIVSQDVV